MPIKEEDDAIEVEVEEQPEEVQAQEQESEESVKAESDSASEGDLEDYSDKVKKRIEKLTYKMREAERREKAATEYAQAVQKQMHDLETRSSKMDESYLNEYNSRVTNEEANVKARLSQAINVGDVDAQMEAQKELARLALETERLKYAKAELESKKSQPQQQAVPQAPQQQRQQPDPKAQSWAEKNTWFGQDEPMTLTAFSIHKNLVEKEYFDPNSDEYYEELDKRMRTEFPHKFDEDTAKPRSSRSPVAPASRNSGKTSGKKVKLSPSQVAIADKLGVSYEQYAKQLARLQS